MSGYPLPALAVRPPEPVDVGRILNLQMLTQMAPMQRQMMQQQIQAVGQENQIRQIQIQDQQAMTRAMQEWDGKNFDSLLPLVTKYGGSANAVMGLKQKTLELQQKYSDIAKNDAETGSKNIETQMKKNDLVAGALNTVAQSPDDQIGQRFTTTVQDLAQRGLIDQQHLQMAQQLSQLPPAQMKLALGLFRKGYMADSQQLNDAKANAEIGYQTAQTQKIQAEMPGGPMYAPSDNLLAQRAAQGDPQAQAILAQKAQQAGAVAQAEAPVRIATAKAEGEARANIEAQMRRGSNAAVANVPPNLVAAATADATKAGTEFAQAQSVTQRLNAMMNAARQGNVVAYQVIPEEGTLQITTSQGVHRINRTEIEQYGGGGSAWDRLMGHVGRQLTGASIPSNVLDDMARIQQIQAEGARAKYENSLKMINNAYGSTFQPVDIGQNRLTGGEPAQGFTRIQASDGSIHDIPSQNLGAARQRDPKLQVLQ